MARPEDAGLGRGPGAGGHPPTPEDIVGVITARLPGVVPKSSWGETALVYNPGGKLPHGVYFCTLKDHDGENDKASGLDRPGIFRVAIGLPGPTYVRLFGPKPKRPAKGGIVKGNLDFAALGRLMPHPIYAWMGWVQILSPDKECIERIFPLIGEAHEAAVSKFNKKCH